jgi:uncharacterized membrane protein YraQ (UPF0718 family)
MVGGRSAAALLSLLSAASKINKNKIHILLKNLLANAFTRMYSPLSSCSAIPLFTSSLKKVVTCSGVALNCLKETNLR